MRISISLLATTTLALVLIASVVHAAPVEITATPKRVAMFKNGFGLVISKSHVPPGSEEGYILSPLPRASFGTLWLSWSGLEVSRVRTTEAWVLEDVPADEIEQMFRSKFGADSVFDLSAVHVQRRVKQPVLAFDVSEESSGDTLITTYLAQGIAWSPSYTVHLSQDTGKATISAKAVVVNDLLDLQNTELELIAGYPNLRFAAQSSAMSPDPLQQILQQLRSAGREYNDMLGNSIHGQRLAYERQVPGASMPSMPATPVTGEGSEDLYFYKLSAVDLKKGERGYFPLFTSEIPAEHIHTWDIPDFIDEHDRYNSEQAKRIEAVWHAIELTNTTDAPWTTAAAATFKNDRILGQDTLHYCPPQGQTRLRITQAVSIDAEQNEFEVERERNAANFHGSNYDLVTIKGELKLTNYKDEPVEVLVTKAFTGELLEADGEYEAVKLARGLQRVNAHGQVEWCIPVEPGKDQAVTLTYHYQVYTR